MNDRYQLIVTCGTGQDVGTAGEAVAKELLPTGATEEDLRATMAASKLSSSDTRSRALFVAGPPPLRSVVAYALFAGFAGRHVDVAVDGAVLQLEAMYVAARQHVEGVRRPETPTPAVIFTTDGGDLGAIINAHEDLADAAVVLVDPSEPFACLTPAVVQAARYSPLLAIAPSPSLREIFTLLTLASATKARDRSLRLPTLLAGGTRVDLDDIREVGSAVQRETKPYVLHVVDSQDVTPRLERLGKADAVDVSAAMRLLGARHNDEQDLWHCPRPERHTNGDATPSMGVEDGKVRCFRCDREWVGALRLTMDTLSLSADEAADMLLDGPAWAATMLTARYRSHPMLVPFDQAA